MLLAWSGLASTAGATTDPIPVRNDPAFVEGAPTARGAWLGWSQNRVGRLHPHTFLVQRGDGPRIRVNARGTRGMCGGIVGHRVIYLQQRRRPSRTVFRILRFDLRTRQRSPLPPAVNRAIDGNLRTFPFGNVSVSGRWLMYTAMTVDVAQGESWGTVVVYDRRTGRPRQITWDNGYDTSVYAGQVSGHYATWVWLDQSGYGDPASKVYRYDTRTGRKVAIPGDAATYQHDPAVSADGTVYFFRTVVGWLPGSATTHELVRQVPGGTAQVVAQIASTEGSAAPHATFVRDRPDGTHVVFFAVNGDVEKVVDG